MTRTIAKAAPCSFSPCPAAPESTRRPRCSELHLLPSDLGFPPGPSAASLLAEPLSCSWLLFHPSSTLAGLLPLRTGTPTEALIRVPLPFSPGFRIERSHIPVPSVADYGWAGASCQPSSLNGDHPEVPGYHPLSELHEDPQVGEHKPRDRRFYGEREGGSVWKRRFSLWARRVGCVCRT